MAALRRNAQSRAEQLRETIEELRAEGIATYSSLAHALNARASTVFALKRRCRFFSEFLEMKIIHRIAFPLITIALALSTPIAHAAQTAQAGLKSEAKVTEAQAQATALTKVPNGTVRSSELEREHGQLIWSFDLAQPSVKGVTEVHVDAKSGKILLVKQETAKQEDREAKAEKKLTK